MDSAMRMQYSPISLLRKSVRGDMVPSKRINFLLETILTLLDGAERFVPANRIRQRPTDAGTQNCRFDWLSRRCRTIGNR